MNILSNSSNATRIELIRFLSSERNSIFLKTPNYSMIFRTLSLNI